MFTNVGMILIVNSITFVCHYLNLLVICMDHQALTDSETRTQAEYYMFIFRHRLLLDILDVLPVAVWFSLCTLSSYPSPKKCPIGDWVT